MTPPIVVSDASVALKWFHEAGEQGVEAARRLLDLYAADRISLRVLDLTSYEIGNALLRGRAGASADETAVVLEALSEVCPAVSLDATQVRVAAELASRHSLSFYDAAYTAVAQTSRGLLATLDRDLLAAGLGLAPSAVLGRVAP